MTQNLPVRRSRKGFREHAFLRIQHVEDLFDLITLIRRGAVVGYTVTPGSLHASHTTCALVRKPFRKKHACGALSKSNSDPDRIVFRVPTGLLPFMRAYLTEWRVYDTINLGIDAPDDATIERIWRTCNARGSRYLDELTVHRLIAILAEHYGGKVEAQMAYGAPGWDVFAREGLGWLVLWHPVSLTEMQDICASGARGIINGAEAERRRDWHVGMSGPYSMPDRGLIRAWPGMTAEGALAASGAPTGLGPLWDRIACRYRLCGFLAGYDDDLQAVRQEAAQTVKLALKSRTPSRQAPIPQDHPVRPVEVLERATAAHAITKCWHDFIRFDLRDDGELDRENDVEGVRADTNSS